MIYEKGIGCFSGNFPEDYPVLEIENVHCKALIALHGAHLMDWTPLGEESVIYTSPDAIFREGKAIRGGVPICWPWFNAHPSDDSLPSHGIARNRFWTLRLVEETPNGTIVKMELKSSTETRGIWDHSFHATAEFFLGETATVSITTRNVGDQPFTVGGALHSYLQVSNISEVVLKGLDGKRYIDTVGGEAEHMQHGDVTVSEEVDRIYLGTSEEVVLKDRKREISITRSGSHSLVVWNPWIDKAESLGDLPNNAYKDFLCIEAANAREDVYELAPGEEHTLSTSFRVSANT